MINSNFEHISNLQYKVKALNELVLSFESGDKYQNILSEYKTLLSAKDYEIRKLNSELTAAGNLVVTMRRNWEDVFDDLQTEYAKALHKKDCKIKKLEERAVKAESQLCEVKTKLTAKNRELYRVKTELEDEQGKNQKLKAQINRDYENSSIPSSMKPNHKIITNSREKSGKKPGGQPGHVGHKRKRLTVTNRINIPAPYKYVNNKDYIATGKIITKQLININIVVSVDEYCTKEFRNKKTGQRVHAQFPEGIQNDVNYGGSVKSFLLLLNNRCNVSIDKSCEFLSELTTGTLNISKGMVNGLSEKFSKKTKAQQDKIFSDLILSPVLNTDCTNARVNGKNVYVFVCATPDKTMYFARENKGHKGVKLTPIEDYQGILVHDHDLTFYNYGSDHQECLVHVLRYLKDSMENEPNLHWNKKMRKLLQEMIHYRNNLDIGVLPDKKIVEEFESKYKDILAIAKREYEYEPPSKYYKDGYNLYKRLYKFMGNHLLFLHIRAVPTDNNLSERLLRIFKRKQKQVMTFKNFKSLDDLCNTMSVIASSHSNNENLYASVTEIFN